jgi:hypothetical protein
MDKAKAAVSGLLHKAGHHDTQVIEKVNPAVEQTVVKKVVKDEIQTAVDKEIHVDHYHTTIQPVKAREILPEHHEAVIAPVQERHIDLGANSVNPERYIKEDLAPIRSQHTDLGVVEHTQENRGTIAGEHVHHHVHETIQPVLQKEVIQPSVVHTTVPIHEVVHAAPVHHSVSALPAVSLSEFERQGGSLSGRGERVDHFVGDPKPVAAALGSGSHSSTTSSTTTGLTGSRSSATSPTDHHVGTDGQIGTKPKHNSSLLNKLDPRVDSDGDGRAGIGK